MTVSIVPMVAGHAAAVLDIYRLGIETGNATFETEPPEWAKFVAGKLPEHRYVALAGNGAGDGPLAREGAPGGETAVVGWVACGRVSDRCAYAGVVEHSVYVHPDARGQGVGRLLLAKLLDSTERAGIWTVQSGIFPENTASLALHRACGFREIGVRERIGRLHGVWRDVILVERRSPVIV